MIILKKKIDNLFFKFLDKTFLFPLFKDDIDDNNIFIRLGRKFNVPIPAALFGSWKNQIKNTDSFLIFDDGFHGSIARYIKKKNPMCKIILWFWNPVNEHNLKFLKEKTVDEFWTYDRRDAEKYSMKFNTQFYSKLVELKGSDKKEDGTIFLGREKGRGSKIREIQHMIDNTGTKTEFIIVENENQLISYDDYLDMLGGCKCILDYVLPGTTGLTLRVMEALFLEKKLITNNFDVINYDFYRPENIFIWGKDDANKLKEFINSPYKKIDKNIVDYYDFENWLKRFEE